MRRAEAVHCRSHLRTALTGAGRSFLAGRAALHSMGAQVVIAFDSGRKRNPRIYQNRLFNKAMYTWDGVKDSIVRSCKNLHQRIRVEVARAWAPLHWQTLAQALTVCAFLSRPGPVVPFPDGRRRDRPATARRNRSAQHPQVCADANAPRTLQYAPSQRLT